jgi:hypothetical protein
MSKFVFVSVILGTTTAIATGTLGAVEYMNNKEIARQQRVWAANPCSKVWWSFNPAQNITAYELSRILLKNVNQFNPAHACEKDWPEDVDQRNFQKHELP